MTSTTKHQSGATPKTLILLQTSSFMAVHNVANRCERVCLALCKVTDTPFHTQAGNLSTFYYALHRQTSVFHFSFT